MQHLDMSNYQTTCDEIMEIAKSTTTHLKVDFFQRHVWTERKKIYLDIGFDPDPYPLGVNLIEFCALDIEGLYDQCAEPIIFGELPESKIKALPENQEELIEYYMALAEESAEYVQPLLDAHPYLSAFPPIFTGDISNGIYAYYTHLRVLRNEFQQLLENCFSVEYYPEELSDLTANQRFYLYLMSDPVGYPEETKRVVDTSMGDAEINALRFMGELPEQEYPTPFEMKNELSAGMVAAVRALTKPVALQYSCDSLYDILGLEFYQMIEHEVKIKRCKNCGRYFILKGRHESDYCTRVIAGQNQTCQNKAAMVHFKQKLDNNEAYTLFTKYYKRYHTRMKNGKIDIDVFAAWNNAARTKRDECAEGTLSATEYEAWLMGSFVNRRGK